MMLRMYIEDNNSVPIHERISDRVLQLGKLTIGQDFFKLLTHIATSQSLI